VGHFLSLSLCRYADVGSIGIADPLASFPRDHFQEEHASVRAKCKLRQRTHETGRGRERGGIVREQGERSILAGVTSSIERLLSSFSSAWSSGRADRAVSSGMNFLTAISRKRKSPRDMAFPVQRLFEQRTERERERKKERKRLRKRASLGSPCEATRRTSPTRFSAFAS